MERERGKRKCCRCESIVTTNRAMKRMFNDNVMNPNSQQRRVLYTFTLLTFFHIDMSSSKQDPRREEAIVPFHLPRRNEEEEDWSHMLATLVCKFAIHLSFRH